MDAVIRTAALVLSALGVLAPLQPPGSKAAPQPLVLEGLRVVINAENPVDEISREALSRIFLRQSGDWPNGYPATAVDQSVTSVVRARFSDAVLRQDLAAVQAYWQQQIFSGRGSPPRVKGSDAEVFEWLLSDASGVGYVSARAALPEGVRELKILVSGE